MSAFREICKACMVPTACAIGLGLSVLFALGLNAFGAICANSLLVSNLAIGGAVLFFASIFACGIAGLVFYRQDR